MPLIEYVCPKCKIKFEKLFLASADVKTSVPCKYCKTTASRCLSTFAFSFTTPPAESNSNELTKKELDIFIGKDSENKWKKIVERENKKKSIAASTGTKDVERQNDKYIPARKGTRRFRECAQKEINRAIDAGLHDGTGKPLPPRVETDKVDTAGLRKRK